MAAPPAERLDERLDELAIAAAGGDDDAWQALWIEVEPALLRMVAHPSFLGRLGQRADDRLNIVVEVMARLRADGCHRLRLYAGARRDSATLRFLPWLRVVAKRVGIDYLRAHPDYVDRRRSSAPRSRPGDWVIPHSLPPASELPGARPPVTTDGTAHQIAALAVTLLPDPQRRALSLWLRGDEYAAIAEAIGVESPAEAARVVRAAVERLRRHCREEA